MYFSHFGANMMPKRLFRRVGFMEFFTRDFVNKFLTRPSGSPRPDKFDFRSSSPLFGGPGTWKRLAGSQQTSDQKKEKSKWIGLGAVGSRIRKLFQSSVEKLDESDTKEQLLNYSAVSPELACKSLERAFGIHESTHCGTWRRYVPFTSCT